MTLSVRAAWTVILFLLALLVLAGCGSSKPASQMPRGAAKGFFDHAKVERPASPAPGITQHGPDDNPPDERAVHNTESYDHSPDNPFVAVRQQAISTFSIDVDTASYSNVRRYLREGNLPPADAVRIEELINYFTYQYPQPGDDQALAVHGEVAECPWNPEHRLLRVGLQGRRLDDMPPRNLVFLIDVSGSMKDQKRLPLVKAGLHLLVDRLTARDRIAIVTYAGNASVDLPSTSGDQKERIKVVLDRLQAGGSTNGGDGIQRAYRLCEEHLIKNAVNRVILATDGDFNVGITDRRDLIGLIERERSKGICLTVLGFGMGNLKDGTLEQLAHHGDGQYAYLDTLPEARKVFVEDGAALCTVAKDVKVQLAFDPRQVESYRLIGYENRLLRTRDFTDDQKDAGDLGSGAAVTALYELRPVRDAADGGRVVQARVRYKDPEESTSKLLEVDVRDEGTTLSGSSPDFKFAAAVAEFGLLLRQSPHRGQAHFGSVLELAHQGRGADDRGHRSEFIQLVEMAEVLAAGR